jgi:hypothetical protein
MEPLVSDFFKVRSVVVIEARRFFKLDMSQCPTPTHMIPLSYDVSQIITGDS